MSAFNLIFKSFCALFLLAFVFICIFWTTQAADTVAGQRSGGNLQPRANKFCTEYWLDIVSYLSNQTTSGGTGGSFFGKFPFLGAGSGPAQSAKLPEEELQAVLESADKKELMNCWIIDQGLKQLKAFLEAKKSSKGLDKTMQKAVEELLEVVKKLLE